MAVKERRNCRYCGAILQWNEEAKTYICPRCRWTVDPKTALMWKKVDVKYAIDETADTK